MLSFMCSQGKKGGCPPKFPTPSGWHPQLAPSPTFHAWPGRMHLVVSGRKDAHSPVVPAKASLLFISSATRTSAQSSNPPLSRKKNSPCPHEPLEAPAHEWCCQGFWGCANAPVGQAGLGWFGRETHSPIEGPNATASSLLLSKFTFVFVHFRWSC